MAPETKDTNSRAPFPTIHDLLPRRQQPRDFVSIGSGAMLCPEFRIDQFLIGR